MLYSHQRSEMKFQDRASKIDFIVVHHLGNVIQSHNFIIS